jgi:hypothetical protein
MSHSADAIGTARGEGGLRAGLTADGTAKQGKQRRQADTLRDSGKHQGEQHDRAVQWIGTRKANQEAHGLPDQSWIAFPCRLPGKGGFRLKDHSRCCIKPLEKQRVLETRPKGRRQYGNMPFSPGSFKGLLGQAEESGHGVVAFSGTAWRKPVDFPPSGQSSGGTRKYRIDLSQRWFWRETDHPEIRWPRPSVSRPNL